MVTTGANASWQLTFMVGCTPVRTVGSKKEPFLFPPQRSSAPPSSASAIQDSILFAACSSIIGPTTVRSSIGSPTASDVVILTNFAINASAMLS